jgi:GNAT superfamily N-acetyltransferase
MPARPEPDALLRPARADEAAELSALALRSKAHWGYSAEFLAACAAELAVDPARIDQVVVATVGGRVAGFRRLVVTGDSAELEALFVDPAFMGRGVGELLLRDALAAAGPRTVGLDADPDAEAFYAKYGAVTVGRSPSGSIPGRTLPRMEFRGLEESASTASAAARATD